MGLKKTGNDAIAEILKNPLYKGFQNVKPYKNLPGGLFALKNHTPIISTEKWQAVQEKIEADGRKQSKTLSEDLPLRGVLKCHCSLHLTGAPSTGKSGKKFLYYKCKKAGHNNINANKAHAQMQAMLEYLSLPDYMVNAIREESNKLIATLAKDNKQLLTAARIELQKIEKRINSIEEKFIDELITAETYHMWQKDLSNQKFSIASTIERYKRDESELWMLLDKELSSLTDLRYLYNSMEVSHKQELINKVFDRSLYYKNSTYRTPYIMSTFTHNLHELKQKELLLVDGFDYNFSSNPVMWS